MQNSPSAPLRLLTTAAIVGLAAVLLFGSAADADVTITTDGAEQGGAARIELNVQNERRGAFTTTVRVELPSETPIAEVYPMTVPDWAPKIITREVTDSLPGIHGNGLTTATSAVIWTRAADAPTPPAVEKLYLEMGPLPYVDQIVFTVVQTYSDGTVHRWRGPAPSAGGGRDAATGQGTVVTLARLAGGAAAPRHADGQHAADVQHNAHGQHNAQGHQQEATAASALPAAAALSQPSTTRRFWLNLLLGVALAAMLFLARAVARTVRAGRPGEPDDVAGEGPAQQDERSLQHSDRP
jgi:uncharacterized protein YcnI